MKEIIYDILIVTIYLLYIGYLYCDINKNDILKKYNNKSNCSYKKFFMKLFAKIQFLYSTWKSNIDFFSFLNQHV